MSTLHRWDALTREEIGALAAEALLVVPVGSTEQHGPHLATGTDALLATAIAERAAEAATAPETILLAPTLAYGASDHHLPFGGTLSLRVSTFQLVLRDLLASDLVDASAIEGPVRGHAGSFETSLLLALDPARVRPELARPSPGGAARKRPRGLVAAEPGRWQELDGFTDRPDEATRERGEAALAACVAAVAAAFEHLARGDV